MIGCWGVRGSRDLDRRISRPTLRTGIAYKGQTPLRAIRAAWLRLISELSSSGHCHRRGTRGVQIDERVTSVGPRDSAMKVSVATSFPFSCSIERWESRTVAKRRLPEWG